MINKLQFLAAGLALALAPAGVSAQTAVQTPAQAVAPLPDRAIHVEVNGLVCDFCVQALTRSFQRQRGLERFHVDLDQRMIHMRLRPGAALDDATITRIVRNAGYQVVAIRRGAA